MPDVDMTVAVPVAPDVHEPVGVASVSGVVEPAHTDAVPPIAAGRALTVTVFVAMQPSADV